MTPEERYAWSIRSAGSVYTGVELAHLVSHGTCRVEVGGQDRTVLTLPSLALFELEGLTLDNLVEKLSQALWARSELVHRGTGLVQYPVTSYAEAQARVMALLHRGTGHTGPVGVPEEKR